MNRWRLRKERALVRLRDLKDAFRAHVDGRYGFRAKDCATCSAPCCADAEFVNVNVTRLEAEAIDRALVRLDDREPGARSRVHDRARATIAEYGLDASPDSFATTYPCPLFEPSAGCLVHREAKPAPCIHHGCYERAEDLPDEASRERVERDVADLNRDVYGPDERRWGYRTIPVWLRDVDGRRPAPDGDVPAEEAVSVAPPTGARG